MSNSSSYFKANFILFAFYLTIAAGNIMIIHNEWTAMQLFFFSNIVGGLFFLFLNLKHLSHLSRTILNNWFLTLQLSFSVCIMYLPVFICQKQGVTAAEYSLQYALVISLLGRLFTRSYFYSLYFFLLLVGNLIYIYYTFSYYFYSYFSLLGPIGGYLTLFVSKRFSQKATLSVHNMMLLRFLLPAALSLILFPFTITNLHIFSPDQLTKVTIVAIFLNIFPIFLSQLVTLMTDHNYVAKAMFLLPFIICVFSILLGIKIGSSVLIFSFILAAPLFVKTGLI